MADDDTDDRPTEGNDADDQRPADESRTTDVPPEHAPEGDEPAESPAEELPADESTERSPVGAMDRSAGELGPAGEGTRPGGPADDAESESGVSLEGESEVETEAEAEADAQTAPAGGEERRSDEPLSELRDELSERGEVADEEFEELFEEIDVGTVDEESLWEELSETAEEPLFAADAEALADSDVTVVEKSLCHRCPHFGDPPELHCTHEGTRIDAEVDTEHFRVVDCPVVAQRADVDASDFSTEDI